MAVTTTTANPIPTFNLWNILIMLEVDGSLLQISGKRTLLLHLLMLPSPQKAFLEPSSLGRNGYDWWESKAFMDVFLLFPDSGFSFLPC